MKKKKSPHPQKDLPLPPKKTTLLALLIEKYGRIKLAIIVGILVMIIDILIYFFFLAPGK